MSNLITRTITGIIFISIILFSFYFSIESFVGLIVLIQILASYEFFKMIKAKYPSISHIKSAITNVISFIILVFGYFYCDKLEFISILCLTPFLILFISELYSKHTSPLTNMAISIFPAILVSLPLFTMILNSTNNNSGLFNYSYHISLSLFFIIWTNDTGAYISGITLGKHRLFERISPKKSWEGFFGGMLFSIIIAYVLSKFFIEMPFWKWGIAAFVVVITGTYGDLFESMIKRQLEIKDSGKILPGHGGILDRFDSILFAAPFYYITIEILSRL
ncbi:MAG: phosphatidate cytidylyltransferase [Bacteroidota bacterium]